MATATQLGVTHQDGPAKGRSVNLRFIDWIWHVRGNLLLAPDQTRDEAFELLDPLFQASGTNHERTSDTLTFRKKDQAAQDKMSIFDGGVLHIEQAADGPVLRYDLVSRALLFCFLAPLLFLGVAQLTIALEAFKKAPTEEADSAKKADAKAPPIELNPIDKLLGAPAPDKPKKDDGEKPGKRGKKPSPTPAYVFAGIFATLFIGGRILEAWLVKRLFRKRLLGE
jgi:hypothetical protein